MIIQTVAVIGAGPLGRRLAALFSGAGFETVLEDIMPSNLRKAAESLAAAMRVVQLPQAAGKASFCDQR